MIERRLKLASGMIGTGLLVGLATLAGIHPLAFVVFMTLGCPLIVIGIAIYLLSLVNAQI